MSIPSITVIPAGAGSGKTYKVQQALGEWVESNDILPERIVAVTFTEAAAGELRERIRSRLLDLNRTEDALKLDQAYISTIHGFGLKILTEFAFESGLTPKPRLLNEDEQSALIRHSLAHTTKVKEIIQNLSAYGYTYNFHNKKSPEDVFRKDILDIIMMLRSMGWQYESSDYSVHAVEWIKQHYGNTLKSNTLNKDLHQKVSSLLKHFPECLAEEFGSSDAAIKDFKNNYKDLKKSSDIDAFDSDWGLWASLRKLRISNRVCKLPEEYDELAQQVMDAADQLPFHPGPLLHASGHIEALLAAGQEVLLHYSEAKRESGLVDYSDMIAMAYNLINENPEVLDTLVKRIDCLVVDEFQDTNPLQFSLLWKLKEAGVPTLIVGDLKQAIMGFQGADARLFHALEEQFPDDIKPLDKNWRSQPRLMEFINAIGPVLFDQAYTKLIPKGGESELQPLEIMDFPKKKTDMHRIRAAYVGKRIKALLEAGDQFVIDRRTKKKRLLQGGDIAVLAPSWNILGQTAEVYRALGLKVKLKEDGWSESREVQITIQALAYVANPADKHAALYLAVTELGQLTLHEALKQLMGNGTIQDPLLAKLDSLAEGISDQTIYTMVADTLNSLEIFDIVSHWPNAQQARANLIRLQAESSEFMDASREVLANGGFYGSGIQSFLAWLNDKIDDNDKQPAPQVIDEDAIEMVTFHSSKGREWPVVVVAGMDAAKGGRLPDLGLGYDSFDDLSKLLDNTHIEYSPKFSAAESNEKFLASLNKTEKEVAQRLLYVALSRAREKLIIEWPSYLQGKASANGSYWSLLTDRANVSIADNTLKVKDETFPCTVHLGNDFIPDDIDLESKTLSEALPTTGRRAISPGKVEEDLVPDSVSPSTLKGEQEQVDYKIKLITKKYSDALEIDSELPARELGTAVHELFEIIGSKAGADIDTLQALQPLLGENVIKQVANQVGKFEAWIQENYSPDNIYRELPFISMNNDGSVVNGTADLVIKNKSGIIIIDHKTDQISDASESFEKYLPQLMTYANELSKELGEAVAVGIHWIRNGELVLCELNSSTSKNTAFHK